MHAPHGIIQTALRGKAVYRDLAGNKFFTNFCFKRKSMEEMFSNEFVACLNSNDAN